MLADTEHLRFLWRAIALAFVAVGIVACGGDGAPDEQTPAATSGEFATSTGTPTEATTSPGRDTTLGEAEYYADRYGVSIQEARRRMPLQTEAGEIGAQLQAAAGERDAGAWLDNGVEEMRLIIRLKGNDPVPQDLLSIAAPAPLPVVFETGATHSVDDLLAVMEDSAPVLQEVLELAGMYPDLKAVSMVVHIQPTSPNLDRLTAIEAEMKERYGVDFLLVVLSEVAGDGEGGNGE